MIPSSMTTPILLFAHCVCDFSLQTEWMAKNKKEPNIIGSIALIAHCFIWAGGISLALIYLNMFEPWKWYMLYIGHWLIDAWKVNQTSIEPKKSFAIDQALHVLQLSICLT